MQVSPEQHSALEEQVSPLALQELFVPQTFWPFSDLHAPSQHSKPTSQLAPVALHASSVH
jgi:hypothetical protein